MPFRRLQTVVEYKALLGGVEVKYLAKKETKNASKTCRRCGHVAQVRGREFRCPGCGMVYSRDPNVTIDIARRITSPSGWGSREPPEPSDEGGGGKPRLNGGSPALKGGGLA